MRMFANIVSHLRGARCSCSPYMVRARDDARGDQRRATCVDFSLHKHIYYLVLYGDMVIWLLGASV